MFKAKSRPKNQRKVDSENSNDSTPAFESSTNVASSDQVGENVSPSVSLEDLLALRKLRQGKQGIEASKLAIGDPKKRKREEDPDAPLPQAYGLQKPAEVDEEDALANESEKVRRSVRKNNFTQQTNALDVDKHMMAYIEENLKTRQQSKTGVEEGKVAGTSSADSMQKFGDKYKTSGVELKEGSVGSSLAMLGNIPEVDLGMDARLRNIEETEKAKRAATEEKANREKNRMGDDEARLAATRFYNPHLRTESDDSLLKKAKYQAMGLEMPEKRERRERPEMASDEAVMERFRKRMKR